MLPSRVWHSLVSTFWRASLSRTDSESSEAESSPGAMTQLDSILDGQPQESVPESGDGDHQEDQEQLLYGAQG